VFEKDMKNNCVRLGVLFFVIFILCNCTYNYEDNKKNYSYDFKKIDLSVASLEIKNLNFNRVMKIDVKNKKVVVMISGGNIDLNLFRSI